MAYANNHWLTVNTIGTISSRDGPGARVHIVFASGKQQWSYVTRSGSYLSSDDKQVHFELGTDLGVSLIEVTWPSGVVQSIRGGRRSNC